MSSAWDERVAALAASVMRDPASSPEDRAAARKSLVGQAMSGSELAALVHRTMSPDDRAAIRRLAEIIATPGYVYTPAPPVCVTVREHLDQIAKLDPEQLELRRVISKGEPVNSDDIAENCSKA